MRPTEEQTAALARAEQAHGRLLRLPDDNQLADEALTQCTTDTRAYVCKRCTTIITIEPDGELREWMVVPKLPDDD